MFIRWNHTRNRMGISYDYNDHFLAEERFLRNRKIVLTRKRASPRMPKESKFKYARLWNYHARECARNDMSEITNRQTNPGVVLRPGPTFALNDITLKDFRVPLLTRTLLPHRSPDWVDFGGLVKDRPGEGHRLRTTEGARYAARFHTIIRRGLPRKLVKSWASKRNLGYRTQYVDDLTRAIVFRANKYNRQYFAAPWFNFVDAAVGAVIPSAIRAQAVRTGDAHNKMFIRNFRPLRKPGIVMLADVAWIEQDTVGFGDGRHCFLYERVATGRVEPLPIHFYPRLFKSRKARARDVFRRYCYHDRCEFIDRQALRISRHILTYYRKYWYFRPIFRKKLC